MTKTNMLWIIAIVSIVLLPNALAATCVNYPDPFFPSDPLTWWGDLGTCTTEPNDPFDFNCHIATNNCVAGYHPEGGWDPLVTGCYCNCIRDPCCGDGVINVLGEQCDNGTLVPSGLSYPYPPFVPKDVWVNMTLNNDSLGCTSNCQINTGGGGGSGPYCGDGEINVVGEECDNGTVLNGQQCTPPYSGSCTYCSASCTNVNLNGGECGDGFCDGEPNENLGNCFIDCGSIYGWHTNDNGWSVNAERKLVATSSGNAINIYSDPFEVRVGKEYTLMAAIDSVCSGVIVDLNDGKCVSRNGWIERSCFTDHELSGVGGQTPPFVINQLNANDASQGFFKNVSVRIHVPAYCADAKFDDISFKEVSSIDPYIDLQPDINLTTACCPKEYCWTGSMCTLSDPWNSSTFPNIWSPLNLTGQIYQHINTSMQYLSRGYRCLVNETGYADWVPAQVKYDWDFRESGYCIRDSDCFVGPEYTASDGSNCINNNQFMNDDFILDQGNHYCLNGEWTTKTYLIANVLENLSVGKPYIIFCDDTGRIFNNLDDTQAPSPIENKISGGCVLISKESNTERIITGFYVETPYDNDMMCQWYRAFYNKMHPELPMEQCPTGFPEEDGECSPVNPPFLRCVQDTNFNLYKNNESLYYLLSNDPITVIDEGFFQQVWNSIVNFFQRLFGYTPQEPLGLANQTTNYDRIYVLSNHSMNVSAIEESKYDEELVRVMVYMYLNMTSPGISQTNNPLNIEFINKSLGGVYYTFDQTPNSQALVIKYNQPAELWPYLTAMLRDRP